MDNLQLNVDDLKDKDITATASITVEQVQAILAEWLKGQGYTIKPEDIKPQYEGGWDNQELSAFTFPVPMTINFPRT